MMWKRQTAVLLAVVLAMAVGILSCQTPAKKPGAGLPTEEPVISLWVKKDGKVQQIKLEDYLLGVVAGEMDPSWPVNALSAQAILARTFTLKKIALGGVKQHGTDASTDEKEFQAYAPEKVNDNVRQAVQLTRGMVCTYQGEIINGWFYADAGGKTAASAEEGLDYKEEPAPYVQSVADPGWQISPPENKSWGATFAWSEVRQAVRELSGTDPGSAPSASIVRKGPSGRATLVKIGNASVSAPALRLALGSEQFRSTMLTGFAIEHSNLSVSGRGFGHGVGMSQFGAKALANDGRSPEDIVKYFFKGVKIEKAWP